MSHRAMPGITEAARGLLFSPRVAALADSIVEQVGRPFVAVHLRIEADWRRWGYVSRTAAALHASSCVSSPRARQR